MKVLLISYFFPPNNSVGGLRASSLCKSLPEEGIDVALLTSEESAKSKEVFHEEFKLNEIFHIKKSKIREIGYKTKILAFLELLKLDKLLFFPDLYYTWIHRAVKQGAKVIQQTKPDAIIATAPPYTAFIVAYRLSIRFNIPLIIDYRDPWSGNPFLKHPFRCVTKRTKRLEKKIIDHAQLLVTVGKGYAEVIATEFSMDSSDFKLIYNGYFKPTEEIEVVKNTEKFTISFFGNFYLIQKEIVAEFLLGLGEMIKEMNLSNKEVVFQYAGNTSRKVLGRMLSQAGISSYFKDLGYLERDQLYEAISRSNVVFDIVPKGTEYMIHTKIYDYCKGHSNIVIVGKKGSIVDLLDELEQVYTSVDSDSKDIAGILKELYSQWKQNTISYGCNTKKLEFFEREKQAKIYASVIKELLSS